ncbi:zinc ABC transporter substrate-binding protein [Paracoccus niistensis]|uniref:High-affinity zinc uptake system protein ZnuA n=1 Tax=Paracoccus niistensis TaxID=632935 RepID=A0ABV6HZW2_9RHOB
MSRNLLPLSLLAALFAGTAVADVPNVAVDIAPVHSLVAHVMEGVGTPALIVAPGASPHEYSLRPSEAGALQEADLVFWVSPALTPWLSDAVETLAGDAVVTTLVDVEGTIRLDVREGALFEAHAHEEDEAVDHGHDDHAHEADHAAEQAEDKDYAESSASHDDAHADGALDPHAWLSPQNAAVWMNAIAAELSAIDPENASIYSANAAAGRSELEALVKEIGGVLEPVRERNFIVFHDAYQYFEASLDLPASGAIAFSDAADPSPARIAEIQARVAELGISCVLSEPQFSSRLVETVLDGTEARSGVLDPLGSDLEPGPTLYPQLIHNLAATLADCLGQ